MKNRIWVLFLWCFVLLPGCLGQKTLFIKQVTDLEHYGLIGKVKTCTERAVKVNYEDGTMVCEAEELHYKNTFNMNGYLTEEIRYDNGYYDKKTINTYDNNGLKTAVEIYDDKDSLISKIVFQYDESKRNIAKITYDMDGNESERLTMKYRENGNLDYEVHQNSKGETSKNVYKYRKEKKGNISVEKIDDKNKNCLERTTYDKNGNLIRRLAGGSLTEWFYGRDGKLEKIFLSNEEGKMERFFDKNANPALEISSGMGLNSVSYRYDYVYDMEGNWTKQTILAEKKDQKGIMRFQPVSIVYHDIEYY